MQIMCTFTAIIVLVLKIIETKAGCYWNFGNPGTECLMYCVREIPSEAIRLIERLYNDSGVML